MRIDVRPVCVADIPAIDGMGTCSYPENYFESRASFESKIVKNLETCWVATVDDYLAGYVVSFPYVFGAPYPINHMYTAIENPNCLYLHDLCVSPLWRKLGVGHSLAQKVLTTRWDAVALTSVMGSQSFWTKLGFVVAHELDYYGLPASYMVWKR